MRLIRLDEKKISAFVVPMKKKEDGKNYFLLGTRGLKTNNAGEIGALGGSVESGESHKDAAEREADEEGNVKIKISNKHKYFTSENKKLRTYITTKYKGKPKSSSEMKNFQWYSKDDLHMLNKKGKLHKSAQVIIESTLHCD